MILLNPKLQHIAIAAGDTDSRYMLNGVHIEQRPETPDIPPVTRLVATDGHRLIVVDHANKSDPADFPASKNPGPVENGATSGTIAKNHFVNVLKACKPKGASKHLPILNNVALTLGETTATFRSTDLEQENVTPCTLIDGKYPNYEQVIPSKTPELSISFNAQYMAELCTALVKMQGNDTTKRVHPIKLSLYGADSPMVLEGSADDESIAFKAVLMPIKSEYT